MGRVRRGAYAFITAVLMLNVMAARVMTLGGAGWEKTGAILAFSLAAVFFSEFTVDETRKTIRVIAPFRYGFWIPFLYGLLFLEHLSVLPRLYMICFLLLGGVLDSRMGPVLINRLFLGAGAILLAVIAMDCLWSPSPKSVILDRRPKRPAVADSVLGYCPIPNLEVKLSCWRNKERIYDVRYHFDEYSRRVVPRQETPPEAQSPETSADREERPTKHAIFMGGSGVFGENIDDHETLPAHFATLADGYQAYNYGYSGYGPQQMLERIRSEVFVAEVPEPEGVLFYGYIPDHIGRANGSYLPLSWGSDFPCYVFENGSLQRKFSFAQTYRRRMSFFNLLRSSDTLNRAALLAEAALNRRSSNWRIFLEILAQSQREYLQRYQGRFYAFLWPNSDAQFRALADSLETRGVESLDLASYGLDQIASADLVPYDLHPSGSYNARVAEALVRAIADVNEGSRLQHSR